MNRPPSPHNPHRPSDPGNRRPAGDAAASEAFARFKRSTVMDLDKWREGIGYDLEALAELTPSELRAVEAMVSQGHDWRDAEALAAIARLRAGASPAAPNSAAVALRATFARAAEPLITRLKAGDELEQLGERVDFVPLIEEMLDASLTDVSVLSRVTDWIEWRHPNNDERVRRKILRLLIRHCERHAVGLASIACVVYGLSTSQYDWTLRPFWLRFAEPDQHDAAVDELLGKIGLTREQALADPPC